MNGIAVIDKKTFTPRVLLFILGCLVGLFIILSSSIAHADTIGVGGGGSGPGTGGSGGGGGSGGSTGVVTKKAFLSAPYDKDNHNFTINCDNAWAEGAGCNVGVASIQNKEGRGFTCSNAAADTSYNQCDNLSPTANSTRFQPAGFTCPPLADGKAAYAQTWHLRVSETNRNVYVYEDGKTVSSGQYLYSRIYYYTFSNCVYPTDRVSTVTCFWNYSGNAKYSLSRGSIGSNGQDFGTRPSRGDDPRPPSGGVAKVAPSCDRTGSAYVRYDTSVNDLGYYKVQVNWTQKTFKNTQWIGAGGAVLRNNWTSTGPTDGGAAAYFAYSCSPTTPNATEGPFNSPGSIPNRDAFLNPANCPQALWQCELATPTTLALDRPSVMNGSVNPSSKSSVMRNGEKNPMIWSTLRIVDITRGGRVDVTNGNQGNAVRNINKLEYKDSVTEGSTPFYGKDANDKDQYFKQLEGGTSRSSIKWDVWRSEANKNTDKAMAFYWASDDENKPFSAKRVFRVSGEFLIPKGGVISPQGPGAPQGMVWKAGTYDCHEYANQNGQRIDKGILEAKTNQVVVLRSTSNK
jgi:hypothetical protein